MVAAPRLPSIARQEDAHEREQMLIVVSGCRFSCGWVLPTLASASGANVRLFLLVPKMSTSTGVVVAACPSAGDTVGAGGAAQIVLALSSATGRCPAAQCRN